MEFPGMGRMGIEVDGLAQARGEQRDAGTTRTFLITAHAAGRMALGPVAPHHRAPEGRQALAVALRQIADRDQAIEGAFAQGAGILFLEIREAHHRHHQAGRPEARVDADHHLAVVEALQTAAGQGRAGMEALFDRALTAAGLTSTAKASGARVSLRHEGDGLRYVTIVNPDNAPREFSADLPAPQGVFSGERWESGTTRTLPPRFAELFRVTSRGA